MKRGLIIALAAALLLLPACSLINNQPKGAEAEQPAALGSYYHFDDVQVPAGMSPDNDKSFVFNVGQVKAGKLVFSERVEVGSLINFFRESMAKDNWKSTGMFRAPVTAMFFAKPGKSCIIQITETTLTTEVAIWVAPAL